MEKKSTVAAIFADPQFWVPVIALVFGIVLLAVYH